MKKLFVLILTVAILAMCLIGCTEAKRVNYNMSKQADYFECERRITPGEAVEAWNRRADNEQR